MARTPRKSKGNIKHSIHYVMDGTAQIFKDNNINPTDLEK